MTQCLVTKDTPAVFVYSGSAPSHKLPYLSALFPKSKFVLVDPNEHYLMYGDQDQYCDEHIDKMLYFVAGAGQWEPWKDMMDFNAGTVTYDAVTYPTRMMITRNGMSIILASTANDLFGPMQIAMFTPA